MGFIITVLGCLLGAVIFKLLSLVIPIGDWGIWSTAILVALMLICVELLGGYVLPRLSKAA